MVGESGFDFCRDFFIHHCVQMGFETHTASHPMDIKGSLCRDKVAGVKLNLHSLYVLIKHFVMPQKLSIKFQHPYD
jgi:hypothetical protein